MQVSLDLTDEVCVEQCVRVAQSGDERAFEQLLDVYYDVMFRYAFQWSGDRSAAEDITQQSCIKLANSIQQFRFESRFSSWLYRLVINCGKDWFKAQRRHEVGKVSEPAISSEDNVAGVVEQVQVVIEPLTSIEQGQATASSEAESMIYLQQILALIDTLGEGFRETVVLVLGQGLNHREAGEILGVKESTISWRLHEVRKQINLHEKDELAT